MPDPTLEVKHEQSEDELREEFEERIENHPDKVHDAELDTIVSKLKDSIKAEISEMVLQTVRRQITSDPLITPDIGVADPTESKDLEDKKKAKKEADEKIGKADDKSTEWTASSYLFAVFSGLAVVGSVVLLLIEYLTKKVAKSSADDLPLLPPEMEQALNKMASDWQTRTPAQYWTLLADETTNNPNKYSLGDQLVFMNITVKIGGASGGFMWNSALDVSHMADALIKAYHDGKESTAAMYRAAALVKYNGAEIPIVAMAYVLGLAFACLGVKAPPLNN